MPILYSGRSFFLSFKPFYYLENSNISSSAYGGKVYFMHHFAESSASQSDDEYTHLILSLSGANQKTKINRNNQLTKVNFQEASFEAQVEKNFYNQFFSLLPVLFFILLTISNKENLEILSSIILIYLSWEHLPQ